MKVSSFINKLKRVRSWEMQHFLDSEYEGSCPCFIAELIIDGKKLGVKGRCWRVSENAQDLYIWGELSRKELKEIAEIIKRKLDYQKWYNPYTIIYKEYK